MKMLTAVLIAAASLLTGCGSADASDPKGLVDLAKNNIAKAKKYHEMANEAKLKQAALQGFVAQWLDECGKKGNVLEMQQDGDPACVVKPVPPTPPTPAVVTPTPQPGGVELNKGYNGPPPDAPGMSRPSTTRTPITPAKK